MDKTKWGDGPWQNEPDLKEWMHNGIKCLARRHPTSGHWCGYIALLPNHPWAKVERYYDINADVHGDITYKEMEHPDTGADSQDYWFGFDCAHAGDYIPALYHNFRTAEKETYKTLEYVESQTNALADQANTAQLSAKELV